MKTRNRRQARRFRNLHRHIALTLPGTMVGNCDEWNDGWSSVGWHEDWEQTYDTSASSFSLGGLESVPPVVRSGLNG